MRMCFMGLGLLLAHSRLRRMRACVHEHHDDGRKQLQHQTTTQPPPTALHHTGGWLIM